MKAFDTPTRLRWPSLGLAGALLAAGCLLAAPGHARDLGVQGKVWEVTEVDLRRLLLESAARADWSQAQTEIQSSANRYLDSLPRASFPVAAQTNTTWFDPSMTLASDIRVPVQDKASGQWSWQVLYRKGERVNPLATHRPVNAMLFFDARDEEQVQFVAQALARNPLRLMPVEASGANPARLTERLGRPVFHANRPLTERFELTHMPVLVYPGAGAQSLRIGRTAFGRPFAVPELERAWPAPRR